MSRLAVWFRRVDFDASGALELGDFERYLESLGLGGGLLGRAKVRIGASQILHALDVDRDGRVVWMELVRHVRVLLEVGVAGWAALFEETETSATRVVLTERIARRIRVDAKHPVARRLAGSIADVAARVVMDLLDEDRDGTITARDVDALFDELRSSDLDAG